MKTFVFSNDEKMIDVCLQSGVDRFIVDLEVTGKSERQKGLNSFISTHTLKDVENLYEQFGPDNLLVRVDFQSKKILDQISHLQSIGVTSIMIPMFDHPDEISKLNRSFQGMEIIPLIETKSSFQNLREVARLQCVSNLHIGLNDLSLQLGLRNMFDILSLGYLDDVSNSIDESVENWGFGGVGVLKYNYKISPLSILAGHIRLNSKQVILTRDYKKVFDEEGSSELRKEIGSLKKTYERMIDESH